MKVSDSFVLISAGKTVTGNVRVLNEDAFLDLQTQHIWAVADGMGGHQSGDFASNLIVQSLSVLKQENTFELTIDKVTECLTQVNSFLFSEAAQREGEQTIGSTVVIMIAFEQQAAVLWMGDSRLYRLRKGQLEQLTVDHSRVQELVNIGAIESATAEDHPMANIITRAVGAKEHLQVESALFDIQPNDRFLLCSDGLYREVTVLDLSVQLGNKNCQESCAEMIDMALQNECRDNVTALVINAIACEETVLSV